MYIQAYEQYRKETFGENVIKSITYATLAN